MAENRAFSAFAIDESPIFMVQPGTQGENW
jgi:hypothetical protein